MKPSRLPPLPFLLLLSLAVLPAGPLAADRPVIVTVAAGERMADFCRRLETLGLGSPEIVEEIARTEPLPEYPFVPPAGESLLGVQAAGGGGSPLRRFEGLFVPGSYPIVLPARPPGQSLRESGARAALQVIRTLLDRAAERLAGLEGLERGGCPPGGGLSRYEALILASIVEKEAVFHRRYKQVASVFQNRLRAGMRLASCPSVEYALGYHRPFLLRSDLALDSPYNTYRRHGLPPTPICFFSDAALQAVLRPVESPFYFFVVDWTAGDLYFAEGFAGHQENVARSRRAFAARYGAAEMYRRHPDLFYEPVPLP